MPRPTRRGPERRKAPVPGAVALTLPQALQLERTGWPSRQERRRFWTRDDVPPELRPAAAPDPRALLPEPTREAAESHAFALEALQAARLAWLEGAADG
jgi:hypothetical protein